MKLNVTVRHEFRRHFGATVCIDTDTLRYSKSGMPRVGIVGQRDEIPVPWIKSAEGRKGSEWLSSIGEKKPAKPAGAMPTAVKIVLAATALLAVVLCAANIVLGPLNEDEGWYLLSALNVADGRLPYRDFFFTQGPMLPAVYGALSFAWSSLGVVGGRLLTAILGIAASLFAAAAVRRSVQPGRRFAAGVTVFLLLSCNVYHSYFTTIPKTYSLASLFVCVGFWALAFLGDKSAHRRFAGAFFGGLALAAASSTRISLGAVLAATGLYLLARFRRYGLSWLYYGIGGAIGLAVFLGFFAMQDFEAFRFANFFHGGRAGGGAVFALGSVSRLLRAYMPIALLATLAVVCNPRTAFSLKKPRPDWLMWALPFAACFAVHALSPFPYDDYQVPLMPLAAMAATAFFSNAAKRCDAPVLAAFVAVAAMFAFSSTINEDWVVLGKDRFWVRMKKTPDVVALSRVAGRLPGKLLTTEAYLAVQAGAKVPEGFEMGPFGYFPEFDDATARRYHVLSDNLALAALRDSDADFAAFSGYGFAMAAPAMEPVPEEKRSKFFEALDGKFEEVAPVPDFGQSHTLLRIWKRR